MIKNDLAEYKVSFFNPAFRSDDLSDQWSVFGAELLGVPVENWVHPWGYEGIA